MKKIDFKSLILFESEDYVVINKPPYLSTLEDRHEAQNILDLARSYTSDAQVCHRLDKETSGCLAIAKNPVAYRNLAIQFEDRKVDKIYHAVIDGIHEYKGLLVDKNLVITNKGIVKINRTGKTAQTYFSTLQTYFNHTLLECKPITGRMHQIRAHLSYIKSPICGDEMYGGKPLYLSSLRKKFKLKKGTEELPIMQRVSLHSYAISFVGTQGEQVSVTAPYPKDFDVLVKQLEKNR